MNFKVATKDVHTNLIVNLKKKEIININQFRFLQDLSSETGFLKPVWTSAGKTNKLCFDISGLMSLYEYLKTTISQEDYFEIVMKIQRCLDYCQKNNMLLGNMICSSKNIYYNSVSGQIWFVYVPLNCEINKYNIIDFLLSDVDKNAHIIISDIASLEEYRQKLSECKQIQKQNKSKNKNSFFSTDKLYNILYELKNMGSGVKNSEKIPLADDSAVQMDNKYRITMLPLYMKSSQQNVITGTVPAQEQNTSTSHTIPASMSDDRPEAFLVSRTDGKRIRIDNVPFFIGRTGENDLVLSGNEKISANHAVIDYKNDCYCIRDTGRDNKGSTNGTFVSNQRIEPMKEIKLRSGDTVSFYKDRYNFVVQEDTDTGNNYCTDSSGSSDIPADTNQNHNCGSKQCYIRNITDGKIYNIFSYPHVDQAFAGICIEKEDDSIYIYNVSCNTLTIEDKKIEIGNRFGIFSGCSFSIDDSKYRFYIGG